MTALFFLLAALGFGFVLIIHELGHYAFAKWAGVRVDVFAVGFGKTILSRRWGETEYCLNILPFGGYVKMLGQEDVPGQQPAGEALDPRSFLAKPAGWRALIMFGGVLFNFVSSFLILLGLAYHGMPYSRPQVGEVVPSLVDATGTRVDSPAYRLGLRQGDWIESIDGERVRTFEDLLPIEVLRTRTPLSVVVERRGQDHPITLPDHDGRILPVFSRASGTPSLGIEQPLSNRIGVLALYGPEPGHPELGERVVGIGGEGAQGGESLDLSGDRGPPLCGQEIGARLVPWHGRTVRLELEKDGVRRTATMRFAGTVESSETGFPVVVAELEGGSAAEKAGVEPGDTILAIDGVGVGDVEQLIQRVQERLVAAGHARLTIARRDAQGGLSRLDIDVGGDRKEGGQMRIGAVLRPRYSGRLSGLALLGDGTPSPLMAALLAAKLGYGDTIIGSESGPTPAVFDAPEDLKAAPLVLTATSGGATVLLPLSKAAAEAFDLTPEKPFWGRWLFHGEPQSIASQIDGVRVSAISANGTVLVQPLGDAHERRVDLDALAESGSPIADRLQVGDWILGLTWRPDGPSLEVLRGAPSQLIRVVVDQGVRIGFNPDEDRYHVAGFADAFGMVSATSWNMVVHTLQILPRFFRSAENGGVDPKRTLTGPVGMFRILKQRVQLFGLASYLRIVALIGLNLFLVNLLPIPITDGGQLLILGVEVVIRRPLPLALRNLLQYIGLVVVVMVMIYVLGLDLTRLL